jgi:hypothetical protein
VVEQLSGTLGESGLLVLPCVAAHINQVLVISLFSFSIGFPYFLFPFSCLEQVLEGSFSSYTKLLVQVIIDSLLVNFWLQKDQSYDKNFEA